MVGRCGGARHLSPPACGRRHGFPTPPGCSCTPGVPRLFSPQVLCSQRHRLHQARTHHGSAVGNSGLSIWSHGPHCDCEKQFKWHSGSQPASEAFRTGILILEPHVEPLNRNSRRFLTSIQVAGWIARVYILVLLLRPVVLHDRQEAPKEAVDRIFRAHGDSSPSAFAVQEDKHHLLLAGGRGLSAYATRGAVAIACGDPLASDQDFAEVVKEFTEHCVGHGWTPSIYLADEDRLPVYHSLGFASQRTAEEAVIDLTSWDPSSLRKFEVSNMRVTSYDRASNVEPLLDEQLEEVTEDWLQTRHIGELGFTLGHFSLESLSVGKVFVLGLPYRIEAFCAWLPYRNGSAMVLDLMRQRHGAPANTAEMLVSESLKLLREMGVKEASLSTVPFRPSTHDVTSPVDRDLMYVFSPRWENRFIVYPRGAALRANQPCSGRNSVWIFPLADKPIGLKEHTYILYLPRSSSLRFSSQRFSSSLLIRPEHCLAFGVLEDLIFDEYRAIDAEREGERVARTRIDGYQCSVSLEPDEA